MGAKRALIVDDSKSARLFLARALEKYDIDVDNAESAEAAIEYLSRNHPDVIFMDHLMPGMDGLQAVKAIKNDPRTATIPIMIYTSQEGELFLGQARALGAVGVLPKQIRPTDFSKVLYQLHLVPERGTLEPSSLTPASRPASTPASTLASRPATPATTTTTTLAGTPAAPHTEAPAESAVEKGAARAPPVLPVPPVVPVSPMLPVSTTAQAPPPALTDGALSGHFAELRRELMAALDTRTERVGAEMRALLAELHRELMAALDTRTERVGAEMRALLAEMRARLPEAAPPPPRRAASPAWAWLIAGAALAVALVSGAFAWRAQRLAESLAAGLAQLRAQGLSLVPPFAPAGAGALPRDVPADRGPVVVAVPFGADPWGGTRLEATAKLLERLARQNVAGLVDIRTYPGRFCLLGSVADGYSLAPEETAFSKCDLVGNPADEALTSAQRTPLALANLIADIRSLTHGALQVQVGPGEAASVLVPYPQVTGALTAGEWNRAGSANNRIEIRER